jgi:hypothetical protein
MTTIDKETGNSERLGLWGERFTFAVMAFLGFVITFVNRVNLSLAIVAMVQKGKNDLIKISVSEQ